MADDQDNTNTSLLGGAADTNAGSDGGSDAGGNADSQGTNADNGENTAGTGTDTGGTTGQNATGDKGETAPIEYNLQFPEGVEVDADAVNGLVEIAKEHKLDPAIAQKVADFGVSVLSKAAQKQAEAFEAQVKAWQDEVVADTEIGGSALQENLRFAAKAIDKFGGDALRQVFDATGLGNHPALVKAFVQIGKAISDDTFLGLNTPATGDVSLAKKLFPYMN